MTDPIDFSIKDLLQHFQARTLSPLEYWHLVEARIAAFEPSISALYAYDPEGAPRTGKSFD